MIDIVILKQTLNQLKMNVWILIFLELWTDWISQLINFLT